MISASEVVPPRTGVSNGGFFIFFILNLQLLEPLAPRIIQFSSSDVAISSLVKRFVLLFFRNI